MDTTTAPSRRRAGLPFLAGAALMLASCAYDAAIETRHDLPGDLYRSPFTVREFTAFAIFNSITHLLVLAGLVAFLRSGLAGPSRLARVGLNGAVAGTALLFVGEWSMLPLVHHRNGTAWETVVDAVFGIGTILATGGMLAAGRAALRDGRLQSWRRYAPLACGVLSVVVIPLQVTSAIWIGIAVYAVGYAVLGLALATRDAAQPAPALRTALSR